MNMKQKQALSGLALLAVGFSLMIRHESQLSRAQANTSFSNPKTIIPESVYLGLNHIENDMNRLRKNIQANDVLSIKVGSSNTNSELVSYRETQTMLNNLITFLKEKQLLFRNDISRSVPGFPLEERLKDDAILKDWKISIKKGLSATLAQVNNLRVDDVTKSEIKKRLNAISNEANKIAWANRSASTKVVTAKANPAGAILNQMQKNLAQLDQDILNLSQTNIAANSSSNQTSSSPWMAWMMAFGGLSILIQALSTLKKDKTNSAQQTTSKTENTIFNGVKISETAIFDRLNQAIFYLSGNYEILWANSTAKKMSMSKNDLSSVLKNAYKDEEGKRISTFNHSDYWLDVEYLDQKMADGNKIFCLIMAQVNDSTSQIKMNSTDFESLMEISMDQLDFDFTQMVREMLGNMSYIFKLSGTEFKFDTTEASQCISEMKKVENASKTLLSAVHQLIKDDFEAKAVVVKTANQNGRLHLSAFVPSLNVEGKLSQIKKLAYQVFLEEMVKVERNLLPYGARVILRHQKPSENEQSGFFIELSFTNINIYSDVLKNTQVTV
jgi:hypothetical protein